VTATRYELDYAARVALARSVALEHELACAQAEVERLRKIIHVHRVYKGFNGKVDGNDHDLWDAAGLAPYNPPDIKGDM
jgi:hypothetical protein